MGGVLCRVDAGPQVGLGHLQRCLSLAEALKRQGKTVIFVAPELYEVRGRIEAAGFQMLPSGFDGQTSATVGDRDFVIDQARAHGCNIVIVDSYDIDDAYVAAVRRAGLVAIVIDDLAAHPFSAHVVVNGAAGAPTRTYRSASGDTQFLLGPRYALLNSAFRDLPARLPSPQANRILVSVGGADPGRALPRMLRSVDALSERFTMTVVIGPFAPDDPDLVPERYDHRVAFVRAPNQLRELIYNADLAVSAGGQTLYELAATGTPAVAVRLFENQFVNIRCLAAAGTVVDGGNIDDPDFSERLSSAVATLIANETMRARISRAGPELIDGRGAMRVAEVILA